MVNSVSSTCPPSNAPCSSCTPRVSPPSEWRASCLRDSIRTPRSSRPARTALSASRLAHKKRDSLASWTAPSTKMLGGLAKHKSVDRLTEMNTAHHGLGSRISPVLSLAIVVAAGVYLAVTRGLSAFGIVLFFVSALLLLLLCWKPSKKASAATGIIAVGAVVYALPLGVVASSPTFGGGLMAIGAVMAALKVRSEPTPHPHD